MYLVGQSQHVTGDAVVIIVYRYSQSQLCSGIKQNSTTDTSVFVIHITTHVTCYKLSVW